MKNKARKFVGIMWGIVAPLALNVLFIVENAIIPEIQFQLALVTAGFVIMGAAIFNGLLSFE